MDHYNPSKDLEILNSLGDVWPFLLVLIY